MVKRKLEGFFDIIQCNMQSDTVEEYTGKFSTDFIVWIISKCMITIIALSALSIIIGIILIFFMLEGALFFRQIWWVYLTNIPALIALETLKPRAKFEV